MLDLSPERREYYRKKQERIKEERELAREAEGVATFIHYYGADAYMELVPWFKDKSLAYHTEVVGQLQKIRNRELAALVNGIYLANGATKSRKVAGQLKKFLKDLNK